MAHHITTNRTHYRLLGVPPTVDDMFDIVDLTQADQKTLRVELPAIPDVPSVYLEGDLAAEAGWCSEAAETIGMPVSRHNLRTFGVLLLAVDGEVFARCWGEGWRLIRGELKDPVFGRAFTVRRADPDRTHAVRHRRLNGTGRIDSTVIARGASVSTFGVTKHTALVDSLGGTISLAGLTASRTGRRTTARAHGAAGLKAPLAVEARALVSDFRQIMQAITEEQPVPDLAFVEQFAPVKQPGLKAELDALLDRLLGGDDPAPALGDAVAAYPGEALPYLDTAHSCTMQLNNGPVLVDEFDADYLLYIAGLQSPGARTALLRKGEIALYRDGQGAGERLHRSSAIKWIEAVVHHGSGRYVLTDGLWYEAGAVFAATHRAEMRKLVPARPPFDAPVWDLSDAALDEGRYNRDWAADSHKAFLCFDKDLVRNQAVGRGRFEACDLLGPDNELIMVKQIHGSADLSHLFSQARVALEVLLGSYQAQEEFAAKVLKTSGGTRSLPPGWRPGRVVFAVLYETGRNRRIRELSAASLMPFSQITLVETARALSVHGVEVQLMAIPTGGVRPPKQHTSKR